MSTAFVHGRAGTLVLLLALCLLLPGCQKSKVTQENFDKIKNDTERDNFMSSGQAKEYGIIDEVLITAKKKPEDKK